MAQPPPDLETLATGYGLIEGPVYDPTRGLLFSDVVNGGVHCLSLANGNVETVIPHRRGIGGMALHANGGLIVSGRNVAFKQPGAEGTTVLLDESVREGTVGFNDLTTDPEGRILVGSLGFSPIAGGTEEVKPGCLHVIDLDGSSRVVAEGILLTNGLGVSPDGHTLYHSDSRAHVVWRYPLGEGGQVGARTPFAEVPEGLPDGMAVSEDGAVWLAVADGGCVLVFEPDGSRRRQIPMPLPMVTSVCFGGEGLRELFVVSGSRGAGGENRGTVFRMAADVAGLPIAPARVQIP